jgi:hypothetical protein
MAIKDYGVIRRVSGDEEVVILRVVISTDVSFFFIRELRWREGMTNMCLAHNLFFYLSIAYFSANPLPYQMYAETVVLFGISGVEKDLTHC